ncbi:MAG: telomere binding protein [Bogoriella megaspora]|nr:MAG: telomere binding protein [Bogoriella megaspora]
MDDLLKPVKTVTIRKISEVEPVSVSENAIPKIQITSPDGALQLLKGKPDSNELRRILEYIIKTRNNDVVFNIKIPEPKAAQIIHLLVNDIAPSYWSTFHKESLPKGNFDKELPLKNLLVNSLAGLPGIGSIVARLKLLSSESKQNTKSPSTVHFEVIEETLDVLQAVLEQYAFSDDIRRGFSYYGQDKTKRTLFWKETITLLASGKIVAVAAQAEDLVKGSNIPHSSRWIANGAQYCSWLGRQIWPTVVNIQAGEPWSTPEAVKASAQFLGKSLGIGYPYDLIQEMLRLLHEGKAEDLKSLGSVLEAMRLHEQRQFLDVTVLSLVKGLSLESSMSKLETQVASLISGGAALLTNVVMENENMCDHLVQRLIQSGPTLYDESMTSIRIMLAVIAENEERLQEVMEKSMKRFGDLSYIKHTPILPQESLAQVLLISAGYVHRKQPMFLFTIARSSKNSTGISNRLAASSSRARFLGMIVGSTISELVDKPGNKLNFGVEELETDDAKWWKDLVKLEDVVGDGSQLRDFLSFKFPGGPNRSPSNGAVATRRDVATIAKARMKPAKPESAPASSSKIMVVEEDDDDDLVPYAKPDSDPDDDDEDPELVNRDKPTVPVYIRDLISWIKDTEKHDRHILALRTAPSLIRRKANFGKEVTDHVVELANLFVGLGDHFDIDDFAQLRLQSLVAVLVAQPKEMGRWFAKAFFEGDYSISQRTAVLSIMGLGARELAGLENGSDLTGAVKEMNAAFPSKQLPEKFHKLYGGGNDALDVESKKLERGMMEPLALKAADKLSGPNALKVRTFSSRMDVEKKRKKPVSNEFSKIVADSFFFPLTGRFQVTLQAYGGKSPQSSPHLLPLYIRTLTLILHAAGLSNPSLPSMTAEFFDLLLGLRGRALQDDNVLEALLFGLLTTLNLNAGEDAVADGGRRLCTEMGREMLEMQGWVEGVFERVDGATRNVGLQGQTAKETEGGRVAMLAAGVLTRIGEIVSKFQRLLVGDIVPF